MLRIIELRRKSAATGDHGMHPGIQVLPNTNYVHAGVMVSSIHARNKYADQDQHGTGKDIPPKLFPNEHR